jgi:hypothetical protein
MSWSDRARTVIGEIHARLPVGASYQNRFVTLREGYPFGARENHPYQAWLTDDDVEDLHARAPRISENERRTCKSGSAQAATLAATGAGDRLWITWLCAWKAGSHASPLLPHRGVWMSKQGCP